MRHFLILSRIGRGATLEFHFLQMNFYDFGIIQKISMLFRGCPIILSYLTQSDVRGTRQAHHRAAKDHSLIYIYINIYYKIKQYSSMYVCLYLCTLISREIPKIQKWKKPQNTSKIPNKKLCLGDFRQRVSLIN